MVLCGPQTEDQSKHNKSARMRRCLGTSLFQLQSKLLNIIILHPVLHLYLSKWVDWEFLENINYLSENIKVIQAKSGSKSSLRPRLKGWIWIWYFERVISVVGSGGGDINQIYSLASHSWSPETCGSQPNCLAWKSRIKDSRKETCWEWFLLSSRRKSFHWTGLDWTFPVLSLY